MNRSHWLDIASEIIGQHIVWCERRNTVDGRWFLISFDGTGYRAFRPRELRNLQFFRDAFNVPRTTAAEKTRFLTALHNHADQRKDRS